jgi:hypothetical protein
MSPRIKDILLFKEMVTPALIQVFFWAIVILTIISAFWSMFTIGILKGLWMLIIGPIISRVICEVLIILFRINNSLIEIKRSAEQQTKL